LIDLEVLRNLKILHSVTVVEGSLSARFELSASRHSSVNGMHVTYGRTDGQETTLNSVLMRGPQLQATSEGS